VTRGNEKDYLRRWRKDVKPESLTWGKVITGDAFVHKCTQYAPSRPRVLEFGFGYNRILKSFHRLSFSYQSYVGVDVSTQNCEQAQSMANASNTFVCGDFNSIQLDEEFDLCMSSLTLKHQYPDCQQALTNAYRHLSIRGVLIADFIEGSDVVWEKHSTYVRHYTQQELSALCAVAGFNFVRFDYVTHAGDGIEKTRLLLVAAKQGGQS